MKSIDRGVNVLQDFREQDSLKIEKACRGVCLMALHLKD
jgi:hypothetical protein